MGGGAGIAGGLLDAGNVRRDLAGAERRGEWLEPGNVELGGESQLLFRGEVVEHEVDGKREQRTPRDLGIERGSVAVAVVKSTNVIVEALEGES